MRLHEPKPPTGGLHQTTRIMETQNPETKTFKVKVVRVVYESFDIEVEAESEEEAKQIALEDADENYWEKLKEYDVKEDAVDYKLSDF